ncbi:MAG: chlorite dismutase [Alphaproteobacteria bacterium PA4]|nr:MAG: chlorite dismutase [Alphaproteobacteria bacterium PA4]
MTAYPPLPLLVSFAAGTVGDWYIDRIMAVTGPGLAMAPRLHVTQAAADTAPAETGAQWQLSGFTSNLRYTERAERTALDAHSAALARPDARLAALIPIRKSPAWWALAQDERRAIFAAQSQHIAIGMDYLPGVARRLHHCRDIGGAFDFLTWFEYAPADEGAFDEMLLRLRATPEWDFVDREVDVRLTRAAHSTAG